MPGHYHVVTTDSVSRDVTLLECEQRETLRRLRSDYRRRCRMEGA